MNPKQTSSQPAPGMGLGDIYYILFRRKWVILGISLLGFIAAWAVYALYPLKYQSVAQLYIAYSEDTRPPDPTSPEMQPRMERGATILNSELEIVRSLDIAKQVAQTIGPGKILGDNSAGTNSTDVDMAALLIERDLVVDVPKGTQIISLAFSHNNSQVAQQVLELIISDYIETNVLIHVRPALYEDWFTKETLKRKNTLANEARELVKAKGEARVVDMAEAMKAITAEESLIKQENYMAMAELDEALTNAAELRNMISQERLRTAPTNDSPLVSTNANRPAPAIASTPTPTNDSPPEVTPPTADQLDAYNQARQRLVALRAKKAELDSIYETNNARVQANLAEIATAEALKAELENATPGLVVVAATTGESKKTAVPGAPSAPSAAAASVRLDPVAAYYDESLKIKKLKARIARQTNQLVFIRDTGAGLVQSESTLHELERDMAMDEEEFKQFEKTAAEADTRSELGNKISGISVSEQPTPPARDVPKLTKLVAGVAGGGVALALCMAFVLEMVLDRSFKRPQEVAAKLGLPFFLSVPYQNGRGKMRLPKPEKKAKLLPAAADAPGPGGSSGGALTVARQGPIAPGDDRHDLRPFHETLRDRLIAYFEMLNLTHKPKLVALTSCHVGAGVSTMASGLASLLSETGDGNVLLVNMTSEEGEAHHFYKGKVNLGLDDLFEKEKTNRENALVQENLYVVKESSNRDKLPAILPKRFSHLVSKMKASDYDYIIFDMPPVTQISVTPRLARFMDMVLLVVESEKTDRDVAQRAAALLSESRANVGVVMNKTRSYVPRSLLQEL